MSTSIEDWQKTAFVKLARLGACVFLPTTGNKFLLQANDPEGVLRLPGGGTEKSDATLTQTIIRELNEELGLNPLDVRKKIKFLGYQYDKKFWGSAVYELNDHGIEPGWFQATNSPDEKIHLVEASIHDPRYRGPIPEHLMDEQEAGEDLVKKATVCTRCSHQFIHDDQPEVGSHDDIVACPHCGTAVDWHGTPEAELYAEKSAKLRPIEERLARLRERRGETPPRRGINMFYYEKLNKAKAAAREKLSATIDDPEVREHLEKGHGYTYGSCGHKIDSCKCGGPGEKLHRRLDVDLPCYECWDGGEKSARYMSEEELEHWDTHPADGEDDTEWRKAHKEITDRLDALAKKSVVAGAARTTYNEDPIKGATMMQGGSTGYSDQSISAKPAANDVPIPRTLDAPQVQPVLNVPERDQFKREPVMKGSNVTVRETITDNEDIQPPVKSVDYSKKSSDNRPMVSFIRPILVKPQDPENIQISKLNDVIEKYASDGFHRPENWDEMKDLSTARYKILSGAEDWQQCLTWACVEFGDTDTGKRVWIELNPPAEIVDGRKWDKKWGRAVLNKWIKLADDERRIASEDSGITYETPRSDHFHEAAKRLGSAIKNHGLSRVEWVESKVARAGQIESADQANQSPKKAGSVNNDADTTNHATDGSIKSAIIRRRGSKYLLYTRDMSRVLGTHPTYAAAAAQETAIQISKHQRAAEEAKEATAAPQAQEYPTTGPEAIAHALSNLDLDHEEAEAHDIVKRKLKSKRPLAVQKLGYIQGFRRAGIHPKDLMIHRVPVIPPQFRPYSVAGDVFIPGDANELYRDLINVAGVHRKLEAELGPEAVKANKLRVYDAVRAVYGFGDPVAPKTKERGVSGFLTKLTGSSPKFGYVQRNLLSRNQDYVSRGVVGVDPDLHLDEIGIPEEHAWKLYAPYIQRRLAQSGMSPADAVRHIRDRSPSAKVMLDAEIKERPVMYSRAPAWHKHSALGGWPKLVQGHTIMVNPLVTTGLAMDFDGDTANVHVPSLDSAVDDVKNKLMPSKMLFSIKNPNSVVPSIKQEQLLGLYSAQSKPAKFKHRFNSEPEAIKAIQQGKVRMSDEVEIAGMQPKNL